MEEFVAVLRRYLDALSSARENMSDKLDLTAGQESETAIQIINTSEIENISKLYLTLILTMIGYC